MKKEIGIYIHIPFCIKKCYYCDFISFSDKREYEEKYFEKLKQEILSQKEILEKSNITTIYIGGGTPSSTKSKNIAEIINTIKEIIVENNKNFKEIETTIEINPGTVTKEKLEEYYNIGINRISIGVQCVQDKLLKTIGRIHNYKEFLDTYLLARKIGFKNINIDLMIGLPTQTIEDIKESIEKILELKPEHISVYSLIVEENTKMERLIENGELQLPDEELERMEYNYVKNKLELAGYEHYEISNFAQKGYYSKHNFNCWNQKEYIGFGVSAHSYYENIRFSNTENFSEYINTSFEDFKDCNIPNLMKNIKEKNKINKVKIIEEIQQKEDKEKEYMLLGLRTLKGVSISEFKHKFGENPIYLFRKELEELINENLVEIDLDDIRLTRKGLDLANIAWEKFV